MVFTTFSGFWLGNSMLQLFFLPQTAKQGGNPGIAVGLFLVAWSIVSLYICVAALATTNVDGVVFDIGTGALFVIGIGASLLALRQSRSAAGCRC